MIIFVWVLDSELHARSCIVRLVVLCEIMVLMSIRLNHIHSLQERKTDFPFTASESIAMSVWRNLRIWEGRMDLSGDGNQIDPTETW